MQERNQRNLKIIYLSILVGVLGVLVFPELLPTLFAGSQKMRKNEHPCRDYFNNETYTDGRVVRTIVLGEIYGSNEEHAADCLASLAVEGDHLLIEAPDEGEEIKCSTLHSAYRRFDDKLKCYGFDVPIGDEARRIYSDLAYRANFLKKHSDSFLQNAKSAKDLIKALKSFADTLIRQPSLPTDPDFAKRQGKYLKKLAKKLSGLSIPEMGDFLIQENHRLVEKAARYEKLSRSGPTNDALVEHVVAHQKELVGSRHRLFAVVGDRHLDPAVNKQLSKVTKGKEPVTILRPKPF